MIFENQRASKVILELVLFLLIEEELLLRRAMHRRNLPAKGKYDLIAPVLSGEQTVAMAAQQGYVSSRSVERWLRRFQDKGFDGLQPRRRKDWQTTKDDNRQWLEVAQALAPYPVP